TFPEVPLPEVWTVEQRFDTPALPPAQVESAARAAVEALARDPRLRPGAPVAVGIGSRGLENLALVARAVVAALRARGLQPFIVPAMGSHGGATAEGQTQVLHSYGIVPEEVGAPIRATMEVEEVGRLEGEAAGPFAGEPVYLDKNAAGAEAILLINRIKAHTDFQGEIESGIAKMTAIGLGKQRGAASIHHYGAYGLREKMPRVARFLVQHAPIVGGIALIENERGETAEVHALPADQIAEDGEKALLQRARAILPRLPFADLDVLIVDEMGKNVSGTGMDTHVIGRALMPSIPESEWGGPCIRLIAVLDLTRESHGNAAGLGLADLTTRRLIEKVDFGASFTNMATSGEGGVLKARLPLILPDGEACVRTALATCGRPSPDTVRLARIRNTAHTQFLEVSGALLAEARQNARLKVAEPSRPLDLCRPVGLQAGHTG
ncbi:MAG TPA: hypothetical protein VKT32_06360, partial [Chthonomonadaceae bacterium]|nr:hypothetical protein [Chthonomonadaceae bacterium]